MKQAQFDKLANQAVEKLSHDFEAYPWENREFYNSWLAQTHAFVTHTSIFLKMCYEKLGKDHVLSEQFEHHMQEEFGHEKMSENDMKFMGNADDVVFNITKAFWKTQYYWIQNVNPTAHLGYSLLLEGLAAKSGPTILKRVLKAGFQGYTFLKVHAEEDHDHFENAIKAVSQLSDQERDYIFQNLTEGMEIYLMILDQCKAKAANKVMKVSA